jgi:hypothetical protein
MSSSSNRYVIAVDVGVKNLGLAIFDLQTKSLAVWGRYSICKAGPYMPSKNVEYVRALIQEHATYFANAHKVLIERQMRVNMRIIESVIQALYFEKCIIMPAQIVKMHFHLNRCNYKANKRAAVDYVALRFTDELPVLLSNCAEMSLAWAQESKQDDLADSLLMVLYYLDTYLYSDNEVVCAPAMMEQEQ